MSSDKQSNAFDRSKMSASFKKTFGIGITQEEYDDGAKFVSISLDDNTEAASPKLENAAAAISAQNEPANYTRSRYLRNAAIGEEMRKCDQKKRIAAARKAEDSRQARIRATLAARNVMPANVRSPTPLRTTTFARLPPVKFNSQPVHGVDAASVPRYMADYSHDIPMPTDEELLSQMDSPTLYTTRAPQAIKTAAAYANLHDQRQDGIMIIDSDSDDDELFVRQPLTVTPPSSSDDPVDVDMVTVGSPTASFDDVMLAIHKLSDDLQKLEVQNRTDKAEIITVVMDLTHRWESNMKDVHDMKAEWAELRSNLLSDFRKMAGIINSVHTEEDATIIPLVTSFINLNGPPVPACPAANTIPASAPIDDDIDDVDM